MACSLAEQRMTDSGGRTAWTSKVTVSGQCIPGRYWFDGHYIDNAKEDAAELALKKIFNAKMRGRE